MVTKRSQLSEIGGVGLILAKIHMVTKRIIVSKITQWSLILAKIHMVTKPQQEYIF